MTKGSKEEYEKLLFLMRRRFKRTLRWMDGCWYEYVGTMSSGAKLYTICPKNPPSLVNRFLNWMAR